MQKMGLALIVFAIVIFPTFPAYAESMWIAFSTNNLTVGDTVTLSVRVSGVPNLSTAGFDLHFDSNVFSYVSGSGTVSGTYEASKATIVLLESNIVQVQADSYSIPSSTSPTIASFKFKANQVTTGAKFYIDEIALADMNVSPVNIATKVTSEAVTVNAPVPKSSNADLKSLTIAPGALAPAFSSDNTVYSAMVSDTTTNLTVSAAAADAKAEVSVSGNKNLQPGENTVKIVVTAESGATKTYTIKVTRTALTPTPSPSPTPAPTPTPGATVSVNGSTMTIAPLDAGKTPPTGFSEATINLQNQMVPAYVSQSGGITLLYLKNSSGTGAFYVYDATDGSFLPFVSINIPARAYVLLPVDGVTAPTGFKPAPVSIAGQTASGFQAEQPGADGSLATLVYLMDSSGIKALYTWNAKASELNRYIASDTPQVTTTPSPTLTPTTGAQTGNGTATGGGINLLPYILAIAGFAALSVVLGALLLYKQYGNRRNTTGRPQPPPIRRVD